jgi:hypothetical protein
MSLTEHERKVVIKDFDSVAKVLVGKHEIPFLLHMKSFSEFFHGACKPEWLDENENGLGVVK